MNCVHVVVNRVFRRRLINHLALENCTKRHKKLSNLLQITDNNITDIKIEMSIHQFWPKLFKVCSNVMWKKLVNSISVMSIHQKWFAVTFKHSIFISKILTNWELRCTSHSGWKSIQNVSFYNITEHHWLLPRDTENYWNRSLRHFWVIFKLYEWAIQFKTVKLNFMDFAHTCTSPGCLGASVITPNYIWAYVH